MKAPTEALNKKINELATLCNNISTYLSGCHSENEQTAALIKSIVTRLWDELDTIPEK